MHVAHFVQRHPPAVGGAEAYFARLGRHCAARGDAVTVWTTTAVDLEAFWRTSRREVPAGTTVEGGILVRRYRPRKWPGRRYLLKALSLVPHPVVQCLSLPCNPFAPGMARDAARYGGPLDAVHASAFPYAFPILCGLRLARRRGVPFLLTPFLHLGDPDDSRDRTRRQYTSAPLRWLLQQADRVFVQTEAERRAVVECGVPESRAVLQGLGVDPAECTGGDREAARRAWGLAPGEVAVGHLANASVEKGTTDLLAAAGRAWAAGHRFRVVLAGPAMPNFLQFWERFGPKAGATRLGVLTDAQKRDFFAGIDAFALPSRTDSFGLVLLEAWANGRPNLVYRAGGPAEVVRDGADGLHAPCGDAAALGRQLVRLVEDAGLRHRLGEAGRARLTRDFAWDGKLELVRETALAAADAIGTAVDPVAAGLNLRRPMRRAGPSRIDAAHASRR